MKLLIDNNLSYKLAYDLSEDFPGTLHFGNALTIHAEDSEIWDYSGRNDLVILTKDNDLDEFAQLLVCPPKVIHLLCGNKSTLYISQLILKHKKDLIDFGTNDQENCLLKIGGHF